MQEKSIYRSHHAGAVTIPYLLYRPTDFDPPKEALPMILFLHGGGERGDNPGALLCHSLPMLCETGLHQRCLVLSPQCAKEKDWYWYMPFLMELADSVASSCNADFSRLSLTGISMGAYGAWELASLFPDRFCSLAPVCGGGMTWNADRYGRLPIWAFHGREDPVIPFQASKHMVDAVNRAGGNARLTLYDGVGHHAWEQAYAEPALLPFLLRRTTQRISNLEKCKKPCTAAECEIP